MSFQPVILLVLAYYQIPPSSQILVSKKRQLDVRSFEAIEVHIQEKNFTVSICCPGPVSFHLVLEDGSVRYYNTKDKSGHCLPYKIISTFNKIHIMRNMHTVKTFENSIMKEAFLKSKSNNTLWKFSGPCSDGDTGEHLCRVSCPGSEFCREHTTYLMDNCFDHYEGSFITSMCMLWNIQNIHLLLLAITAVAFIMIFLWFNWIRKISKTRQQGELILV